MRPVAVLPLTLIAALLASPGSAEGVSAHRRTETRPETREVVSRTLISADIAVTPQLFPKISRHRSLSSSRSWLRPSLVAPSSPPLAAQPTIPVLRASGSQVPDARVPAVRRGEASAAGTKSLSPKDFARSLIASAEFSCLDALWTKESGWRATADNPTSTAYGIAQELGERSPDARTQIRDGLTYISARYGTPCAAWAFWRRMRWY